MVATANYGASLFSIRGAPVSVCVRLNDTEDRRLCLLADHAIIMLDRTEVDLRPSAVLIYFHCFRHSNRTVWFLIY